MRARIGGEAGELEGWHDRANGGSNRKVSQDASMDLKAAKYQDNGNVQYGCQANWWYI